MDKGVFGPFPILCSDLAKELVKRVRAKNLPENNFRGNDTAWTDAVFGSLREIGEALGFKVCHRRMGCEFLLDLVWCSESGGIELGAECQWNSITGQELRDIKKVVYMKCPLKLFVWWDDSQSGACGERIRRAIESYLKTYTRHIHGEEYLSVSSLAKVTATDAIGMPSQVTARCHRYRFNLSN